MSKEIFQEMAMTAACMAQQIYEELESTGFTELKRTEVITKWAMEFVDKYKYVQWEKLKEDQKYVAEDIPETYEDWDEIVRWYGLKRLKEEYPVLFNGYPLKAKVKLPAFTVPTDSQWDCFEIQPIKEFEGVCEVCDPEEAEFWSVYVHLVRGGVDCIADVPGEKHAYELVAMLESVVRNKKPSVDVDYGYLEIFFEVNDAIFNAYHKDDCAVITDMINDEGRYELINYAKSLTDEFEKYWDQVHDLKDNEFWDEIESWMQNKLYPEKKVFKGHKRAVIDINCCDDCPESFGDNQCAISNIPDSNHHGRKIDVDMKSEIPIWCPLDSPEEFEKNRNNEN